MVNMVAYFPSGSCLASRGIGVGAGATRLGMRGTAGFAVRALGVVARGALLTGRDGLARPDNPSRCTLPITAFRVTPPNCLAIWLALSPSAHNFDNISTLSSVHAICSPKGLNVFNQTLYVVFDPQL
jgi:hypothetical protein